MQQICKLTLRTSLFLLVALALSGCTASVKGNWSGKLITEAINITLELSLTGTNDIVAGSWHFIGADELDLGDGGINGTHSGNMVQMVMFKDGNGFANLTGVLSADGQTMSGTYNPVSGAGGGGFNVTKQN